MQKISLQTARYNVDALIERGRQRVLFSALLVRDLHRVRGMPRSSRATTKIIPSGREDKSRRSY